jgi:hypothetical protein
MDISIILIALIALALAALRWGVTSTDDINSPEMGTQTTLVWLS